MAKRLIPVILAGWVCAIALLAIQNASPVTLRLLVLQSIPIPIGLVLAFSVALGMVLTAIVLPLWQGGAVAANREDFE